MARVLISLIGGRPVPNILVALHLKPDKLYFVGSQDAWGEGGNYQKAHAALPGKMRPRKSYPVEPYTLQGTIEACREIVNQNEGDEIIINSASEPKPMAFGAYDIAKELIANGVRVDLCYLGSEGLVWIFKGSTEPVTVGLKTYFTSYGWNIRQREINDDKLIRLSSVFVKQLDVCRCLLQSIRNDSQGKNRRSVRLKKRLADDEYKLFQEVEKLGIISNLYRDDYNTSWTINSHKDGEILLSGDWLEQHVYQTALGLTDHKGKRLFEECAWGIEDTSGKGEIDFAGIRGGQLVVASCKTTGGIKRIWIEDLHSKAEQLGKGMCSSLMISTGSTRIRSNERQRYNQWAKGRRVVLIFAENIPKLPEILRKIALAERNAEPKDIPYYPRI